MSSLDDVNAPSLEQRSSATDEYRYDERKFPPQLSLSFPFSFSTSPVEVVSEASRNQTVAVASNGTGGGLMQAELRIALYVAIFVLSVAGNGLVAVTITQNRRMRTLTNVLLMNLSVADLLLAAFCMPFTLIPTLLRDFIFGPVVCVLARYMQGVSVGVSAFTLVAISLERYFAICRPLRSRRWQTVSHSYKIIGAAWTGAFTVMFPIAITHRVRVLPGGARKCDEDWDNGNAKQFYTVFLDVVLLVLPLVLMSSAYGLVSYKLWPRGAALARQDVGTMSSDGGPFLPSREAPSPARCYAEKASATDEEDTPRRRSTMPSSRRCVESQRSGGNCRATLNSRRDASRSTDYIPMSVIRQSSEQIKSIPATDSSASARHHLATLRLSGGVERCIAAKRRVVKMLFVVVIEFFVCWTPTYVLQTWDAFDSENARTRVSAVTMNLVHLLGFASACCHPITYGFMNASFRRAFLAVFCSGRRYCGSAGRGRNVMSRRRLDSGLCGSVMVAGGNAAQVDWPPLPLEQVEDQRTRSNWFNERRRL